MATTGKGIATQANANDFYTTVMGNEAAVPYQNASEANRCITRESAEAAGFLVAYSITGQNKPKRLVMYSDLGIFNAPTETTIKLKIDISDDPVLYNNGPIRLYTGNSSGTQRGLRLGKGDGNEVINNLLDSTVYGPVEVVTSGNIKTVTYTLLVTTPPTEKTRYLLEYDSFVKLRNAHNLVSSGQLVRSAGGSGNSQGLGVTGAGTYIFSAYWQPLNVVVPPPGPSKSWTFRLRFRIEDIVLYQIQIQFSCTIYDRDSNLIKSCSLPATAYRLEDLPLDMVMSQVGSSGESYYFIDLYTGNTYPRFVKVSYTSCFNQRSSANSYWNGFGMVTVQNDVYTQGGLSGGGGTDYITLNPHDEIYSIDYVLSGGAV